MVRCEVWATLALIVGAGCTTSAATEAQTQSAVGSACAWIAGHWEFSGCEETDCTYYEDNCQVHYDCNSASLDNSSSGTGAIVGNAFTFGGGECTATINGRTISGKCPTCTFTATHR